MLRPLHAYFSHSTVTGLGISQRGMLAVGHGRKVALWQGALREKAQSPYMTHHLACGVLQDLAFVPFEDVLGVGHSGGVSTLLVPGEVATEAAAARRPAPGGGGAGGLMHDDGG